MIRSVSKVASSKMLSAPPTPGSYSIQIGRIQLCGCLMSLLVPMSWKKRSENEWGPDPSLDSSAGSCSMQMSPRARQHVL